MVKQKLIILFALLTVLLCCVSVVSAASNDTVDNVVCEIDSNDEFISVSNCELVDDMDESVLSAQSKNANWTVNVDGLSDNDLLSDDDFDDDFDDDDDDDDGEYNDYDDNDYSEVDKNKEYFYNRIHSGNTLYFEFLTHLVDKCGFVLDIKNSDVNNQVYKLITNKDYSFKLYDGKQFNLKKGESYIASFNNRFDYNNLWFNIT